MSWCRVRALSRLVRHLDRGHDHHVAAYSRFRPTRYSPFPFSPSAVEDLFFSRPPSPLQSLFRGVGESSPSSSSSSSSSLSPSSSSSSSLATNSGSRASSAEDRQVQRYTPFGFPHPFAPLWSAFPAEVPTLSLNLNVYSTPTAYQIEAEAPGVKKEEIVISVEKGTLTIQAERKAGNRTGKNNQTTRSDTPSPSQAESSPPEVTADSKGDSSSATSSTGSDLSSSVVGDSGADGVEELHVESYHGRVSRSITLPDDAELDNLTAKYEDGVIKLEIPRKQTKKQDKKIVQLQ